MGAMADLDDCSCGNTNPTKGPRKVFYGHLHTIKKQSANPLSLPQMAVLLPCCNVLLWSGVRISTASDWCCSCPLPRRHQHHRHRHRHHHHHHHQQPGSELGVSGKKEGGALGTPRDIEKSAEAGGLGCLD